MLRLDLLCVPQVGDRPFGAFATKDDEGDNCRRCHNADQSPNGEKFFAIQKSLPRAKFGNEIDWVKALDNGSIKPRQSLSGGPQPMGLDKTLTITAEMSGIPPAVFPHKAHVQWLDCQLSSRHIQYQEKDDQTFLDVTHVGRRVLRRLSPAYCFSHERMQNMSSLHELDKRLGIRGLFFLF